MVEPAGVPGLADLAAGQAGALHLDDCRAAGLTEEQIRWQVESGRWQSPFPRVVVMFSGPIPRLTLLHAAILYAGDGAVLCAETAGVLWGLCRWPDQIHVMVPYEREVLDQPGLRVHRSRTLSPDDVHPVLSPRRLRIERTVCDLLRRCRTVDAALALVADAARSRRTTPSKLRRAVSALTKTRWRHAVLVALPDIDAGAHSLLEIYDARLRRRHGLPSGQRQFTRRGDGVEHLDVVDREYGVHVELDGRLGHDTARETWRDYRRDNASEVGQMRHLRYGWADVLGRGCEVMAQQAIVYGQQGWPGPFLRCRNCPSPKPGD